jgi:hypothetical protein
MGDSGTLENTFAERAENELAKVARVSAMELAGTYCTTVSTSKNGISNVDTLFVKLRPILYGVLAKSTPSICPPAATRDWNTSTDTAKIADSIGALFA